MNFMTPTLMVKLIDAATDRGQFRKFDLEYEPKDFTKSNNINRFLKDNCDYLAHRACRKLESFDIKLIVKPQIDHAPLEYETFRKFLSRIRKLKKLRFLTLDVPLIS